MPKPKIKRSKPMKSKSSMVVRVVAMNKRHTTPDDSTILEENSPWKMKLQNLHYKRTLERQEFSKMATNFQKEIEALKAFHAEEIEKERNNFLFQIETAKIEAVHNYRSKLKGRLSAAHALHGSQDNFQIDIHVQEASDESAAEDENEAPKVYVVSKRERRFTRSKHQSPEGGERDLARQKVISTCAFRAC